MSASAQRSRFGERTPAPSSMSNGETEAPKCFECGKPGHKARHCRSKLQRQGPGADRDGYSKNGKGSTAKRTDFQKSDIRKPFKERAAAAVDFDDTSSGDSESEIDREAKSRDKNQGSKKPQH